jgi:uncharacterized damage-inducible protein DinB
MEVATIRELYEYNRWANARMLESVAAAPANSFTREVGGSFQSLRGTVSHMVGAEWIWLERWRGNSPRALPAAESFPDLESIRRLWRDVEAGQREVLDSLDEARLAVIVSYVNPRGETWAYPLGRMMQHLVNHSTYHRGQVTTLLRQLGETPSSTDLLLYDDLEGSAGS